MEKPTPRQISYLKSLEIKYNVKVMWENIGTKADASRKIGAIKSAIKKGTIKLR